MFPRQRDRPANPLVFAKVTLAVIITLLRLHFLRERARLSLLADRITKAHLRWCHFKAEACTPSYSRGGFVCTACSRRPISGELLVSRPLFSPPHETHELSFLYSILRLVKSCDGDLLAVETHLPFNPVCVL